LTEIVWLLRSSLRLLLLLRPRAVDPRRLGVGHVLVASVLFVAVTAAIDAVLAGAPRAFDDWGLTAALGYLTAVWLAALVTTAITMRPALRAAIAALLTLTLAWMGLLLTALDLWLEPDWHTLLAISGAWTLLILRRTLDGLDPGARSWRRAGAALGGSAVVTLAVAFMPHLPIIDSTWEPQYEEFVEAPAAPDAEALLFDQRTRVEHALAALEPQRPGVVDMYFLAFGADGSERVFTQEADYAARLFAQRLDAAGRTLVMANDLRAPAERPLATLSGLRVALDGLGRIMDPDEDILFLFLTTHGSKDHQLYVHLPPLPLAQIRATDLREALDAAGIRWRVLLVSACYSGGFIETLGDATTLVMTAARADRSSFGCGPDSDITWFGRAYFAEALNRTSDLVAAFGIARDLIEEWEQTEDFPASHPQIRSTPLIETKLRVWSESFTPGPALAFETANGEAGDEEAEMTFSER
jgi:hypothetical protein